jgi:hypothetical protein
MFLYKENNFKLQLKCDCLPNTIFTQVCLSGNPFSFVRFEVFTAVTVKNTVFWDVAPCRSCVNRPFGGTYRLNLQGRKILERGTSRKLVAHTAATCLRWFLARGFFYLEYVIMTKTPRLYEIRFLISTLCSVNFTSLMDRSRSECLFVTLCTKVVYVTMSRYRVDLHSGNSLCLHSDDARIKFRRDTCYFIEGS